MKTLIEQLYLHIVAINSWSERYDSLPQKATPLLLNALHWIHSWALADKSVPGPSELRVDGSGKSGGQKRRNHSDSGITVTMIFLYRNWVRELNFKVHGGSSPLIKLPIAGWNAAAFLLNGDAHLHLMHLLNFLLNLALFLKEVLVAITYHIDK
jgi:hypothetical protein